MAAGEVKVCAKLAPENEIDDNDLLFFCPMPKRESEDSDGMISPIIPETLQHDFCHTTTQVKNETTKVLAGRTSRSDRDFIGEGCTKVCNDM